MLTDDMLISENPHMLGGGVQRLYRLPNGYGLSLVNCARLHAFAFAWEAAVCRDMGEDGMFSDLAYDTPLTADVEVFMTDEEANDFIARAKAWALGEMTDAEVDQGAGTGPDARRGVLASNRRCLVF